MSIQPVMMEQGLLLRFGAAASLVGHTAVLGLALLFASVQPYQSASSKPIKIDLVPQQELDRLKTETVKPPPEISPPPEPAITKAAQEPAKPAASSPKMPPPSEAPLTPRAQQPPPAQQAPAQQAAATPVQQQSPSAQQAAIAPSKRPPSSAQQAALSPAAHQPTQSMAPQVMPTPLPPPMASQQAPDVTQRYHVMLGLPEDSLKGSGGQAAESAKIATSDTDKLREHLRGCASLPASIGATDKIRIVIRAMLSPDGTLAAFPTLIEASASPKGPSLMQAAIGALQACQPYTMLPPDKYKEWRVLDIPFTPLDFKPG